MCFRSIGKKRTPKGKINVDCLLIRVALPEDQFGSAEIAGDRTSTDLEGSALIVMANWMPAQKNNAQRYSQSTT